jgi:hypothetical protein
MLRRAPNIIASTRARLALALAGLLLAALVPAAGQQPPQAPEAEKPAAAAPPPPARPLDPGPFTAFGRLIDESITGLATGLNNVRPPIGDATGPTGATTAPVPFPPPLPPAPPLPRLPPPPGVVAGREFCPPAANGAPNCEVASAALCRAKGFKGGRSIDMQTEQRCPAEVWAAGRQPAESECVLESYVTRAICQ